MILAKTFLKSSRFSFFRRKKEHHFRLLRSKDFARWDEVPKLCFTSFTRVLVSPFLLYLFLKLNSFFEISLSLFLLLKFSVSLLVCSELPLVFMYDQKKRGMVKCRGGLSWMRHEKEESGPAPLARFIPAFYAPLNYLVNGTRGAHRFRPRVWFFRGTPSRCCHQPDLPDSWMALCERDEKGKKRERETDQMEEADQMKENFRVPIWNENGKRETELLTMIRIE